MKKYLFLILGAFLSFKSLAQQPYEYMVCEVGDSVLLQASDLYSSSVIADIVASGAEFDSLILTDDQLSPSLPIGFNFEFWGVSHSTLKISSNVYLKFPTSPGELDPNNAYSPWSINSALPNNAATYNTILCPYTDVNPSNAGSGRVRYGTFGTAPNRIFVAIWPDMSMFQCTSTCFSNSIVLFEGTNKIQNYLGSYTPCPTWNGGVAVQGLVNANGTSSIFVQDPVLNLPRNWPLQWTAVNEMVEYTPNATGSNYTYTFAPFAPVGYITWVDQAGNILGEGYTLPFQVTAANIGDLPLLLDANFSSCTTEGNIAQALITYGEQEIETYIEGPDCVDDQNGQILFVTEGGEDIDWDIELLDAAGNTVDTYSGDVMPVVFDNLSIGNYQVVSVSPTTCEYITDVLVEEKFHDVEYHAEIRDVLCNGGATGIIDFSPHGGNNEQWNLIVRDSLGNTVSTFNVQDGDIEVGNLPVGEYSLEIVSPTTCLTEAIYSVGEPEPLEFDKKEFDHAYCDESNAYLDYTPRGGVAPYTYYINGQEKLDLFEGDLDQGIYDIRVEDANGCDINDKIRIFDKFPPEAYFEVDYEEINLEDATIHFTDATITNDHSVLVKWRWHFGDGGTSTEPNPIHTYTDIGEYKVILQVYDENNCFSEVTRFINVIDPVMIYPTAFTPNGDGINEFFKPVKSLIRSDKYLLVIYDRWGKEMFRTNDVQQGWAGFDKTGKEASAGTYVWKAEYMDDFMHEKQQEGVFQLMR